MDTFLTGIVGLLFWAGVIGFYFVPTIIAAVRKMPNAGPVALVNVLLGWTFVGWVIALVMACVQRQPAVTQSTHVYAAHPVYRPGDIVNGHRLSDDNRWLPVA